jgi:excisionase family DNA binding protein
MSDLARAWLEELASDPVALERLRELVGVGTQQGEVLGTSAPAFTVATLAAELGRTPRSIRAAIARGELQAVWRGRGWLISADAVADWARPPAHGARTPIPATPPHRRSGPGPATRALHVSR